MSNGFNNQNKINEEEDFNEQYDLLFNPDGDQVLLKQSIMKSSDLDIDKDLGKSKNIVINNENNFLSSKIWDYLDNNKMNEIENKCALIYKKMNKKQLEILKNQIKKCELEFLYKDFNPKENTYKVGTISSLDFLIETTYYPQEQYVAQMFSDKNILNQYIYKFRNVLGDGDCFYRGIIFSFLENIIFTNNINLMKELFVLFYEKINKENPLLKKKECLNEINKIKNIDIVYQILYVLISYMDSNDIKNAYIILLKVFLFCKDFDYGIIYFTRYLLYEYISENENKIYSRENQIEIGCFLPEEFFEDKGEKNEYYFENYYTLQLLKPKTFAEKIVIYIAPFVFNCEVNILVYDFGYNSSIHEKKFISEKNSKTQINLLFRKAHYDIYYTKDYYNKYADLLDILINRKENICILDKNEEEALKLYNNNLNNDDYEKFFEEQGDNFNGSAKCLECKNFYHHKENVFGLCNECLYRTIKDIFLSAYINYLQSGIYTNRNVNKFDSFLSNHPCSISVQKNISIKAAILNSGIKFKDLFLETKRNICLFCGYTPYNQEFYIELPCNCRICKEKCFKDYVKYIEKKNEVLTTESDEVFCMPLNYCPCGEIIDLKYILSMINILEQKKLSENYKKIYFQLLETLWKWKCMICGQGFDANYKFYRIYFSNDELKKLIKKKIDFKHLICASCAQKKNIKNEKNIKCNFCDYEHKINDIKEVDRDNSTESCIII